MSNELERIDTPMGASSNDDSGSGIIRTKGLSEEQIASEKNFILEVHPSAVFREEEKSGDKFMGNVIPFTY